MVILRESPWYQEILKEGIQQGIQQGEKEGEKQGKVDFLIRLLSKRFGQIAPGLESKIRQLEIPQLEALSDNLFDFSSLTEVENWLENHD